MPKKFMMSVTAATGLVDAIKAAGGDAEQILSTLGLDRAALSRAEGSIACSTFARLLEEAARATSDPFFGLHFGERFNPKNNGPLVYVVLNSPTVAAGFETAARYLHVHNQAATASFSIEGDRVYLRYLLVDPEIESPRQQNEYGMAVVLSTLRLMVGSDWVPQEVHFVHEAGPQIAEHLRVFGAPVLFGCAANALVVEREFFERQVPAADQRLYRILKQYLEGVLNEIPREPDLLAAVRKTIGESMRDGDPKLTRVAKRVAMSPRTLQRQLKEHGVDFKQLMDDTRKHFALNYLRDRRNTLTEIAFLLGYSELSAFNRAFRRWTGSTPLDYRRRRAA